MTGQSGPGGDIAGNIQASIQRWLIRSGAENVRREMGDQVRKAFGGRQADSAEVWRTAVTETPPETADEAPECAWCPVCRTARRIRESGTQLSLSGAGDAVAAAVQEALAAFDSLLSARPRPRPTGGSGRGPDGRG